MPPIIPIIIGAALAASGIGGVIVGASIAGLAGGLILAGGSLLASGILGALAPKPKVNPSFLEETTGRTITVRQAAAPRRMIYGGPVRVGGIITFLHTTGTDNEKLNIVITLSGHEAEEIGTMYFDGESVPLDGSGDATGEFAGHVHVQKNLGSDTQAALSDLVAEAPTKWTTNHRQRGCAHVYVRLKFNADLFPNGMPNIAFDVKGKKVFDPRTSTTVFSTNAALCAADYFLDTRFGLKLEQAKIDDASWQAAANVCDENVTLKVGGTEDRYTTNGSFQVSQTHGDVIQGLLAAMGGTAVWSGGKWYFYAGAWRAPTLSFDEGDLRGSIQVRSRHLRRELFNAVKGLYVSAANNWQPSDFPAVVSSTHQTEDGGERIFTSVDFPFTISAATAQRLAKIHLERHRRQKTVTLKMGTSAYRVFPPDIIQLTNARFGWTNKTFEVVDFRITQEEDSEGVPLPGAELVLREADANIYAWNEATDEGTPTAPGTTSVPDPLGSPDPASQGLVLVKNPGFENGDRNWTKETGWSIVNDTANAYDGQWAGKWIGTAAAALRNSVFIPVQPGDVISASLMGKRTAGSTSKVRVRITWWDASKVFLPTGGTSPGTEVSGSAYSLSHVADSAPAGAFFARIEAEITSAAASNTIFVDSFRADIFAVQFGARNPIENSGVMVFNAGAIGTTLRPGIWRTGGGTAGNVVISHVEAAPAPVPTGRCFQAAFTTQPDGVILVSSPKIRKNAIQLGKPYTDSIFARVTSGTASLHLDVRASAFLYAPRKAITLTTTWRRFAVTYLALRTNDDALDTGVSIAIVRISGAGNFTGTIQITGAMHEDGQILHSFQMDAVTRDSLFEDALLPQSFENLSRSFNFASATVYQVSGGGSIDTVLLEGKLLASAPPTNAVIAQRLTDTGATGGVSRFTAGDDVTVVIYPFYKAGFKPTQDLTFKIDNADPALIRQVVIKPDDATTSRTGSPFILYIPSLTGSTPYVLRLFTVEDTNAWYIAAFVYYRGRGLGKPLPSAEDLGIATPSGEATGGTAGSETFSGGGGGNEPRGEDTWEPGGL